MQPEGLGKWKNIDLIGPRTRDLPACSILPQALHYHVPPYTMSTRANFEGCNTAEA
jgi:hypothetical protein